MTAWAFALEIWGRPGVAHVCLELQDDHGQCPPLWLWRLWTLESGRCVSAETLAEAVGATRLWQTTVVAPLRAARVALKAVTPPFADTDREALRVQVRAAELGAERLLIDTLERLTAPGSAPESAAAALTALADAWGRPAPAALIERFLAHAASDELDRDGGKGDV